MQTFCLQIALDGGSEIDADAERLDSLARRVGPFEVMGAVSESLGLPGVSWIRTEVRDAPTLVRLVSRDVRPGRTVVAFGTQWSHCDSPSLAALIASAIEQGGFEALRGIDGCFGAVVLLAEPLEAWVVCDALGQRCLRVVQDRNRLLVSPHDAVLASLANRELPLDAEQIAVHVGMGWPVGGGSVYSGVVTTTPTRWLRWSGRSGGMEEVPSAILDGLGAGDGRGRERVSPKTLQDQLLDDFSAATRARFGSASRVRCELSAGMDSRAVLGAGCLALGRDRLVSMTDGPVDSLDVRVGRRVARAMGVEWEEPPRDQSPRDIVLRHLTHVAVASNGVMDASIACTSRLVGSVDELVPSLCGDGGEIYRGFYPPAANVPAADAVAEAALRTALARGIGGAVGAIMPQVELAIRRRVSSLAPYARNSRQLGDLFYAFERFGVWNAKLMRNEYALHRWGPFFSRGAFLRWIASPEAAGGTCPVHESMICRWAGPARWIAVNGREWAPLALGPAPVRRLSHGLKFGMRASGKLRRIALGRLRGTGEKIVDIHSLRQERLQQLVDEDFANLVEGAGVVAGAIGGDAIRSIVSLNRAGYRPARELLGTVVTIEELCRNVSEARVDPRGS